MGRRKAACLLLVTLAACMLAAVDASGGGALPRRGKRVRYARSGASAPPRSSSSSEHKQARGELSRWHEYYEQPPRQEHYGDPDACQDWPCKDSGQAAVTCTDLPGRAPNSPKGRTCTCNEPGYAYIGDKSGCRDVNACKKSPCAQGAAESVCHDLPPPAPATARGRQCACPEGFIYINDLSGCVDALECSRNHWSKLCNPCGAPPAGPLHAVFNCSGQDVPRGRICRGTCVNGTTPSTTTPKAKCVSTGWIFNNGTCMITPTPAPKSKKPKLTPVTAATTSQERPAVEPGVGVARVGGAAEEEILPQPATAGAPRDEARQAQRLGQQRRLAPSLLNPWTWYSSGPVRPMRRRSSASASRQW